MRHLYGPDGVAEDFAMRFQWMSLYLCTFGVGGKLGDLVGLESGDLRCLLTYRYFRAC